MAQPPPASTLVIVTGFTVPEFKVEVEAIAAKAAMIAKSDFDSTHLRGGTPVA